MQDGGGGPGWQRGRLLLWRSLPPLLLPLLKWGRVPAAEAGGSLNGGMMAIEAEWATGVDWEKRRRRWTWRMELGPDRGWTSRYRRRSRAVAVPMFESGAAR